MTLKPPLLKRPASPWAPPSRLYMLVFHPVFTFFTILHTLLLRLRGVPYRPNPSQIPIRVVCISDTHSKIPPKSLPPGDLLIHAGDLTNTGTLVSIQQTIDWLKTLQKPWYGSSDGYRYIIVISGNHDSYFDPRSRSAHDKRNEKARQLSWGKIIYLEHSSVILPFPGDRKLKVYGAPQLPKCGGKEFAFQYPRGHDAWTETVPQDADVLVTHTPPKWHRDLSENGGLGCEWLTREIGRVKPTLHVCGHIHSSHGMEYLWWDQGQALQERIKEKVFTGYLDRSLGGKGEQKQDSLRSAIGQLCNLELWQMGLEMVSADLKGLVWTRLWKGQRNGSILVNAAMTYQTTERLGNRPQVVLL